MNKTLDEKTLVSEKRYCVFKEKRLVYTWILWILFLKIPISEKVDTFHNLSKLRIISKINKNTEMNIIFRYKNLVGITVGLNINIFLGRNTINIFLSVIVELVINVELILADLTIIIYIKRIYRYLIKNEVIT